MIRGLVLAGGKSSRFGEDKALALYEGTPLLERAVSLLDGVRLKPVVITRRGSDYPFLRCTVLHDKLPGLGPLGGIYTAMTVFKSTAFLILTTDMPALTQAVLEELLDRHEAGRRLTFYSTAGIEQPFPAVYEPSLLGIVRERFKNEQLSMKGLFKEVPLRKGLDWTGAPSVFCNVNEREELDALN